jgi:hypothetical protein
MNRRAAPLFAIRGIQPFHDFPEGPDWWNRDDYLAVISQLPKLGMNFIGLHTYPEGSPNAEPTVWIGLPEDIGEGTAVKFSYPASYQNTGRGNWGYAARKTGDFMFGAAQLFAQDDYAPDVVAGHLPQPGTVEACNEVFEKTGELLREAFTHARRLGVKTCVGTETPLTIPKAVAERLEKTGKSPKDPKVVEELYTGMFRRASQAYPLDYYWFWTPEGWTWEGTKAAQVTATTNDLFTAIAAAKAVQTPFQLATCGWVLGPQQDRAMFDNVLPKSMPVSCINREVGKTPVDIAFGRVSGRPKWAIPWLEDDPALTSPQLWAGRMRRDAYDARQFGCDGLLGIHWRTRSLGPNVAALAQASWKQGHWTAKLPERPVNPPRQPGAVGGLFATFADREIADTQQDAVYQTVRYKMSAYRFPVANAVYRITLQFCEPAHNAAGKRVFDVKLQGRTVVEDLDIFARVGRDRALDLKVDDVTVTNGWLDIEFVAKVEFPSLAGLVIESPGKLSKINCGGPAWQDYTADYPAAPPDPPQLYAKTLDFYEDWAKAEFGPEIAKPAGAVFDHIDCDLPRTSDWVHGPGGIRPDARPWETVQKEYAFIDRLAALRAQVRGPGHLERFDYWLDTFKYMRAMAQVNCTWARYTNAFAKAKLADQPADAARATVLPIRVELIEQVQEVYRYLLATVSNPGELGTVANWEQHLIPDLLTKPGLELAKLLDEELPREAQPRQAYQGPLRIIVPTLRTGIALGEELQLKILILAETPPRDAVVYSRPLGTGRFRPTTLEHVSRSVCHASLPRAFEGGLEYYVKVTPVTGAPAHFPVTAPDLNQTLVAYPVQEK